MGIPRNSIFAVSLIFAVSCSITKLGEGKVYESPEYTVMHSESDFEVRFYRESVWMSAPADEISFEKATRLPQYNSPFKFIGRVNEVWVAVNGSEAAGCKPHLVAEF